MQYYFFKGKKLPPEIEEEDDAGLTDEDSQAENELDDQESVSTDTGKQPIKTVSYCLSIRFDL